MATQQLIVQKPYSYCRNPMALGAIVAFLGVAILIGSISAMVLVLAGMVLLLAYIKLFEENEMELPRFGGQVATWDHGVRACKASYRLGER
jgi:protein-S-isoprenylcysteine O-methyltransferase Ste14